MGYIVTHGGRPHLDDVMACALAMCRKGPESQDDGVTRFLSRNWGFMPIYRREPTAAELEDPNVVVVDVGGRLEPSRSNFDHHQLDRADCRCAMRLIAGHIRVPYKDGSRYPTFAEFLPRIFPWWDTLVRLDQQGPYEAARHAGMVWDHIVPFIGPLAEVYLDQFADERLSPQDRGSFVYSTLACYVSNKVAAYFDIAEHLRREKLGEIEVLDFTECDPRTCEDASKAFLPETGVAVFVARPRREGETWDNTGLTLMRIGDDMRVDFTKVESEPSVRFAHKGGFLAQLKERDMDEARRLIHIATA